jgi:hypothetical protein
MLELRGKWHHLPAGNRGAGAKEVDEKLRERDADEPTPHFSSEGNPSRNPKPTPVADSRRSRPNTNRECPRVATPRPEPNNDCTSSEPGLPLPAPPQSSPISRNPDLPNCDATLLAWRTTCPMASPIPGDPLTQFGSKPRTHKRRSKPSDHQSTFDAKVRRKYCIASREGLGFRGGRTTTKVTFIVDEV